MELVQYRPPVPTLTKEPPTLLFPATENLRIELNAPTALLELQDNRSEFNSTSVGNL
jgi:hypothetical protein